MKMLTNIFYMYSKMDNSSQILIFLIVLVIMMLISIFVINTVTRKRNDKYNKKFDPNYRYKTTKYEQKPKKQVQIIEKTAKVEEVKEPKKEEELEVVEIVSNDNSIEKISELLEDSLNNMEPINLTGFEEDQEKNAIISYDELVKRAGAKKIVYKTSDENKEKVEVKKEEKSEGKFKASKVISPIYGVQKENTKEEELEEFIDITNIPINKNNDDDEMQSDIEFLGNLKSFRRNLE